MTAMAELPPDVTLGELWRGQLDLQRAVRDIADTLRQLPHRVTAELDVKHVERLDAYRREHDGEHDVLKARMDALSSSMSLLWRIVWAVIGFVFLAVGAGILQLVITTKGAA